MTEIKKCFECGSELIGRTDKKFCDHLCKSNYHNKIYREEAVYVNHVNKILKTNRRIIERFSAKGRASVPKVQLEKSGFNFNFYTHIRKTSKGITLRHVYEYGYTFGPNNRVLISIKRAN